MSSKQNSKFGTFASNACYYGFEKFTDDRDGIINFDARATWVWRLMKVVMNYWWVRVERFVIFFFNQRQKLKIKLRPDSHMHAWYIEEMVFFFLLSNFVDEITWLFNWPQTNQANSHNIHKHRAIRITVINWNGNKCY